MDRPGPSLLLLLPFVNRVMGAILIFRQGRVRDGAPLPHLRSSRAGEVGCPEPPCSAPPSPHPHSAAQFPDLSGPQSRLPHLCTLSVRRFLSVTIKCTSDLPRLIGDLVRPDTGHPPPYGPDTPRAAQTMTGVGAGRPSPFSVCRQRPLSLVWCLAGIGDSS